MSKSPKQPTEKTQPKAPLAAPPTALPVSLPYRTASLPTRKATRFDLRTTEAERAAIAEELGLIELQSLKFKGEITPSGSRDFQLVARLEAEIVQPSSISLAPVPGSVAEDVRRLYVANWVEPDAEEIEMPEDDTVEALPEVIDIGAVVLEALSLSLPLYPRAAGETIGEMSAAPEGAEEIEDEKIKPFAGLAALKAKLSGENSDKN